MNHAYAQDQLKEQFKNEGANERQGIILSKAASAMKQTEKAIICSNNPLLMSMQATQASVNVQSPAKKYKFQKFQ